MAGLFLNVEEVAQLLKLSNAEVVQLSASGKIHGYRDGATWKYKKETIEDYLKKQRSAAAKSADDDYGFGSSDSDVSLMNDSEDALPAGAAYGSSDINLTLDDDVSLEDSVLAVGFGDDGDLILGEEDGIGLGSGLALGEGSGISLMSANDSGISLEGGDSEVLELGDDDVLAMSSSISGMDLGGDEDFNLTSRDEYASDDDDSGSQVIVLDNSTSAFGDDGMFAEHGGTDEMGVLPPSNQIIINEAGLPEKPFSIWEILGLFACLLVLVLTLMFSVDLMRNMWSWDKPMNLNSGMMDWILEMINGK